jgi:2Fe-2S ferredoxin
MLAAMPQIRLLPVDVAVEVPSGTTLLDAVVIAGLPIARSCGADGICGKCALRILTGVDALSPESDDETRIKSRNRVAPELRLACRVRVLGDVTATASYW